MKEMYEILLWADSKPFRAEVKHSTIEIRPKVIICTSNMDIKTVCESAKMCESNIEAVEKRFK